ncbi:putative pleckstrin homology domain containing protein [Lyophyllum shimeji]|uniref:Pleckstrin homology domain containing protein n=1 Tax=Lyophyllum shimeji TaxID=47721 RepID=A0A9P3UJ07_LYOSH|nr:putative pleckstrin homology domain containing protein [Lyophyllum shimeji]
MVGRFGTVKSNQPPREPRVSDLGNPPPYDAPNPIPPIIVAETTTTRTEVVTTTTTHFFSLPLWRKRAFVPSTFSRQGSLEVQARADEHGTLPSTARSSVLMVEKDLPPTPSEEDVSTNGSPPGLTDNLPNSEPRSTGTSHPSVFPDVVRAGSSTSDSLPPMPSTAALAHASLGLSLPHVLPGVSPSSPSSEINTVAFALPIDQPQHPAGSPNRIRRSKSAQKLKAILSLDPVSKDDILEETEHRRTRGVSVSGSTVLRSGQGDAKGKGKEQDIKSARPSTSPQSSPKGLARRASFWSRKKSTQQDRSEKVSPHPSTPRSSQLPSLPPISPCNMNIAVTPTPPLPTPKMKNTHSRGLSRSHSAHSSLRPLPSDIETSQSIPSTEARPKDLEYSSTGASGQPTSAVPLPSPSVQSAHERRPTNPTEVNVSTRRPRAQTNPPLLNRLSLGWFPTSSTPSPPLPHSPRSPEPSSTFSRPHTSAGSPSSAPFRAQQSTSALSAQFPSSSHSSRPSLEKGSVTIIPLPSGKEESPEVYLKRLQVAVSKAEIAGILASSPDAFYAQALRTYIGRFNFVNDPLDVALRKLLMEVGLPRETQQIDRVMEAFAGRYLQCNPALFTSDDHPYILAFSLIMLHTDAFNRSNKRKMGKADYLKNTRLPGVAPEVLDCFYDNIVFAPFIFIEDPLDINGQRRLSAEGSYQATSSSNSSGATPTAPGTPLIRTAKLDPYYLITNDLLGPLRVDVEAFVPKDNPYSYEGTAGPWDEARLQLAFAKASRIEFGTVSDATRTSALFSLGASSGLASPLGTFGSPTLAAAVPPTGDLRTLKLTKVGLLNRKDDILEGGRKASNRKWRQCSVVLTGSQLLFFRDPTWASSLSAAQSVTSDGHAISFPSAAFKPDELLSVKGAIAVYDKSYTKHANTFRFVLADGRQTLLQASHEKELNEWISAVNYASAFKSAGVRMRPLEMSGLDIKLTGVAAATSHLHDLQIQTAKSHTWDSDAPRDLMGMLSGDPEPGTPRSPSKRRLTIVTNRADMDLEVPVAPEIDGAEQFKATFDQVKADLAAGRLASDDDEDLPPEQPLPDSTFDIPRPSTALNHSEPSRLPSRAQIIHSKIEDLNSRISAVQSQLDANMRFVRNVATLTPFQKSTRDRLTAAVQNVAQRIMQVRLEITKLVCHRNVLTNDLASEGRSWQRAKVIALRAATETLQNRSHERVPRMTLSDHTAAPVESPTTIEPSCNRESFTRRRPESSICESFHSALDFGPDWPSTDDATSSFLGTGHLLDSPSHSTSSSLNSHSLRDSNVESPRRSLILAPNFQRQAESSRTSGDIVSHEKFYTALEHPDEEAEEWNRTRCAQRVSLVRLPSDINLKTRFGLHSQQVAANTRL